MNLPNVAGNCATEEQALESVLLKASLFPNLDLDPSDRTSN